MAEEQNTNVEEVTAETTAAETPQVNEAQANPEQFLKDFNWHNYVRVSTLLTMLNLMNLKS